MECKIDKETYTDDDGNKLFKRMMRAYQEHNYMIFRGEVKKIMNIKYSYEFLETLKNNKNLFKSKKVAMLELIKRKI